MNKLDNLLSQNYKKLFNTIEKELKLYDKNHKDDWCKYYKLRKIYIIDNKNLVFYRERIKDVNFDDEYSQGVWHWYDDLESSLKFIKERIDPNHILKEL